PGEIRVGPEQIDLLFQQEGVGAEVDEFLAGDDALDNLLDLAMEQRLAAGDDDDRGSGALLVAVDRGPDQRGVAEPLRGRPGGPAKDVQHHLAVGAIDDLAAAGPRARGRRRQIALAHTRRTQKSRAQLSCGWLLSAWWCQRAGSTQRPAQNAASATAR